MYKVRERERVREMGEWLLVEDSNIILKYSILGDCFGLEKTCL